MLRDLVVKLASIFYAYAFKGAGDSLPYDKEPLVVYPGDSLPHDKSAPGRRVINGRQFTTVHKYIYPRQDDREFSTTSVEF